MSAHSMHWPSLQHMQKREVEDRLGRRLHLSVVVRARAVRSCVDSCVEQCDLSRRRPANLSLLIGTTVASAAYLQVLRSWSS